MNTRRTRKEPRENTSRRTGPWEPQEDEKLLEIVRELGVKHWKLIGIRHGLRDGKQCRERWHNHLNPDLTYGPLTPEEDKKILSFYSEMGTKWAVMSQLLGRPANLIKNRYYSSLSKKRDHAAIDDSDDSTISTCTSSDCSPRPKKRRITKTSLSNCESSRHSHSRKKSFKSKSLENSPVERWIPESHRYPTRHQINSWHSLKTPISSPEAVDIPCPDLNCPNYNYSPPSNKFISIPTPTYTPIPSPVPIYHHNYNNQCTAALEQLADLAIQNARETTKVINKPNFNIMSISAVLN
ncbi:Homeodomain-like protein [Gigaspora rosea]|uniref:Homeodomain-like protein n=1 Tax=Gigaspora rosea TaxID=44941 RepID=A0A397UHG3_9GLOM|nr:Homeodomain-like protein [Gigaspora rosea]